MRPVILLLCLLQAVQSSVLQTRLQAMLTELAALAEVALNQSVALQIGWYGSTDHFTVAAGTVDVHGSQRNVTTEDTFLYGSGTKPFTAAALMRLIDQGKIKASDRAHIHIDPYLRANNGTELKELFGPEVHNATVLDLIRMSAGIPDFEAGSRDAYILQEGSRVWPVYDNIRYAAAYQEEYGGTCKAAEDCDCGQLPPLAKAFCEPRQEKCMKVGQYLGCLGRPNGFPLPGGWVCWNKMRVGFCPTRVKSSPLVCAPGACSFYSSASYELAGLLIAAVGVPDGKYTDMDLGNFTLPSRDDYPTLTFPPVTRTTHSEVASMKLSDHLSVPGHAALFGGSGTVVFDQNPTVLGWTCGHMIGAAGDVAKFFFDLFSPKSARRIVSNASLAEMTRTAPLSMGWGTHIEYGAGIMAVPVSNNASYWPENTSQWGFFLGHGGMTYGFSSNQGYISLADAGFSDFEHRYSIIIQLGSLQGHGDCCRSS
ncbi:unnamed protein product [Prorocentrum cordatum]|uniref:Beta-lactamase-related domain-containing protein n=1 Tax=Prorocentrum cordatum TaxID=2364126 RepID=A0ABN9WSN3_9DINO|nr:unnamed protein product [Polarella glacialis]